MANNLLHDQSGFEVQVHISHLMIAAELLVDLLVLYGDGPTQLGWSPLILNICDCVFSSQSRKSSEC